MTSFTFEPAPDFERVRTALTGGCPDRVPSVELGVDLPVREAILGRPIRSVKDDIEFWYKAGYDYNLMRIKGRVPPDSRDDAAYIAKYGRNPEHVAYGNTCYIGSWEDFEEYPWQTSEDYDYSQVEEAAQYLPEGMKTIVNIGPFFSGMWRIMSLEEFSIALFDEPELVKAIADKIGEGYIEITERLMTYPHVQAIWMGDDLAYAESLMVAPWVYRDFIFPWEKKIGDICRANGRLFIRHSDGKLDEILEDMVDCGYHALHPFEPKAMDIVKAKKQLLGRAAVIGSVEVDLLSRGTPEEVSAEVIRLLKNVAPGGGYALSSSNSVTDYVPVENYVAMLNTLRKYGDYPISIP